MIWLGVPAGLMYFHNEERLFTTELMVWGPLTFEWGAVVDSGGSEWSISVSHKEPFSLLKRLRALFGGAVETRVEYNFARSGGFSLEELKSRLISQSENDPGDIMWQYIEHKDIVEGVMSAKSIPDLFDFLAQSVCQEDEA